MVTLRGRGRPRLHHAARPSWQRLVSELLAGKVRGRVVVDVNH